MTPAPRGGTSTRHRSMHRGRLDRDRDVLGPRMAPGLLQRQKQSASPNPAGRIECPVPGSWMRRPGKGLSSGCEANERPAAQKELRPVGQDRPPLPSRSDSLRRSESGPSVSEIVGRRDQVAEANRFEPSTTLSPGQRLPGAQRRVVRVRSAGSGSIRWRARIRSAPGRDLDQWLRLRHQEIEQALSGYRETRAFRSRPRQETRSPPPRAPASPAQAVRRRDSPTPFHGAVPGLFSPSVRKSTRCVPDGAARWRTPAVASDSSSG